MSWTSTLLVMAMLIAFGIAPGGYSYLSGHLRPVGRIALEGVSVAPQGVILEGRVEKWRDCDFINTTYALRYGGRWVTLPRDQIEIISGNVENYPGNTTAVFGPVLLELRPGQARRIERLTITGRHQCIGRVAGLFGFVTETILFDGDPFAR